MDVLVLGFLASYSFLMFSFSFFDRYVLPIFIVGVYLLIRFCPQLLKAKISFSKLAMNQALKNKACIFDTCKMSGVQKFNKCPSILWKKNMWNSDGASTDACLWKVIPPTLKYPYYPVSWRRASCVARRYEVRRGFLPADYRRKYLCTFIGVSCVYWVAPSTASGEDSSVTLWTMLANHLPSFLHSLLSCTFCRSLHFGISFASLRW